MLLDHGVEAVPQLERLRELFKDAVEKSVPIVMHNKSFDLGRLEATAEAHGLACGDEDRFFALDDASVVCTMRQAPPNMFKNSLGHSKPPSNTELYIELHGAAPDPDTFGVLHTALADALVTHANFAGGRLKDWW